MNQWFCHYVSKHLLDSTTLYFRPTYTLDIDSTVIYADLKNAYEKGKCKKPKLNRERDRESDGESILFSVG